MSDRDPAKRLKQLKREHDFFIGIDSDGCAFDSMEIKHKECFIPNTIKHWRLQAVSKYARETAEFVNLYSKWRGINRFPALVMLFDLLRERQEVRKRGVEIPQADPLRDWIAKEPKLGNPALKSAVEQSGDAFLQRTLRWSQAVNSSVADIVKGVGPFPFVRETLHKAASVADIVVVSATPGESLQREWAEHNMAPYAKVIAGQEMGSKTEHLGWAAKDNYPADHILMIGDAPGDLQAARTNKALFYPINPGSEEQSWQRFFSEALDKFIAGRYAGAYEANVIAQFEKLLPDRPPWTQKMDQ